MKKLWEKNYVQNKTAEQYCFGDTSILDTKLVPYEVMGSIAHGKMLTELGILSSFDFKRLKNALVKIFDLHKQGRFVVQAGDEDVHTSIENYLTATCGKAGEKIHTGRSRNDQVLVDLRLYTKDHILTIVLTMVNLISSFLTFAKKYEFIPMPGYTHMQKAMPSSIGMWAGSFAESLVDDLHILENAYEVNDQNPLGSGASYGVSLPIDRNLTSDLLGFSKIQNNALYCQTSRPKSHFIVMHALTQVMLTLSRFAEDILLFTTSEFNFFSVDKHLTTGSSIMPQKKNLDIMEMVRAKTQEVIGFEGIVSSITAGLPSGYNADFGQTKWYFFKSFEIASQTLEVVSLTLKSLKPNADILERACTKELFAAHEAYQLVKKGLPFRQAYKKVGMSLETLAKYDAIDVLKESDHIGGPGNLGLEKIEKLMNEEEKTWKKMKTYFDKKMERLKKEEIV